MGLGAGYTVQREHPGLVGCWGRLWGLCEIWWSGRSERGLGAGYTVQRDHLSVLGWGGGSGDSVRFGGLGGLGGVWGLSIQYRGSIIL